MKGTSTDILTLLNYGQAFTRAVVESAENPHQRAALVTQALQALWPSPLSVCLLQAPETAALSLRDEAGLELARGEELLGKQLDGWLRAAQPGEVCVASLPDSVGIASHQLVGTLIHYRESRYGLLGLALPRKDRSRSSAIAPVLLTQGADHLAQLLRLERLESGDGRKAPAVQSEPPTLGGYFPEIAYSVAHEFNNILNNILLQVAILEQSGKVPELMPSLARVRQMGHDAAGMIRQLQQLSRPFQSALEPTDLNRVVEETVSHFRAQPAGTRATIQLELAPELPAISGTTKDLAELVSALLRHAVSASPGGTDITLRTRGEGSNVWLHVEDNGPSVPDELLPRLFEPLAVARPGSQNWELTICKALARRLRGSIQGENRPRGGMALAVQLRAAPS